MGGTLINRRQWLYTAGMVAGWAKLGSAAKDASSKSDKKTQASQKPARLPLSEYEPKSMLRVKETRVERARFSCIDIHTHISVAAKSEKGIELTADRTYLGTPQELLGVM